MNPRYAPLVGPAGGLMMLLGIVRGLLTGVWNQLTTPYGLTFLVSIVLAGVLAFIGARLIAPAAERMAASTDAAEIEMESNRLTNLGRIELAGFAIVLAMMVAMRFGY